MVQETGDEVRVNIERKIKSMPIIPHSEGGGLSKEESQCVGSDTEIDIYKIRPDFVAATKKGKDEFEIHYTEPKDIIAEVVEIENKITSGLNSLIKRVE